MCYKLWYSNPSLSCLRCIVRKDILQEIPSYLSLRAHTMLGSCMWALIAKRLAASYSRAQIRCTVHASPFWWWSLVGLQPCAAPSGGHVTRNTMQRAAEIMASGQKTRGRFSCTPEILVTWYFHAISRQINRIVWWSKSMVGNMRLIDKVVGWTQDLRNSIERIFLIEHAVLPKKEGTIKNH